MTMMTVAPLLYLARGLAEAGQNTKIGVSNLGGSDDNSRSMGMQGHKSVSGCTSR